MSIAIVSGSAGLIGSETVRALCARGVHVIGVDNDMRRTFFGDDDEGHETVLGSRYNDR